MMHFLWTVLSCNVNARIYIWQRSHCVSEMGHDFWDGHGSLRLCYQFSIRNTSKKWGHVALSGAASLPLLHAVHNHGRERWQKDQQIQHYNI